MTHEHEDLRFITLSELHERLKGLGVTLTLSKLSEFISSGDVSEQLNAGGKGNRREFLPGTVAILAEFLPQFRSVRGISWSHAPASLRAFLKNAGSDLPAVSSLPENEKPADKAVSTIIEHIGGDLVAVGQTLLEMLENRTSADDCVFDARSAAEFLCCSVRMLRSCVPASFRLGATPAGDRWYRRELLKLKGSR